MADGGDGLSLKAGGRGQQGPGGGEDNFLPLPLPHPGEEIAVQYRGGAAAAGAAGVHVLLLPVVEEEAAVLEVFPHVNAVPGEEVPDDGVAQLPQVSGGHQVIVLGLGFGILEEGGELPKRVPYEELVTTEYSKKAAQKKRAQKKERIFFRKCAFPLFTCRVVILLVF